MRTLLKYLTAVVVGLVIGLGSAWWLIRSAADTAFVQNGPWRISTLLGSKDLDLYSKAYVAGRYLFAMNKVESIYYMATTDSQGEPLSANCTYLVKGVAPNTRWWSLTAYDSESYLIDNPANRYSFSSDDLGVEPGQEFQVVLGSEPRQGKWLPTGKGQSFNLLFRLYNPSPDVYQNVANYPLPQVIKEVCK